jgi:hypothetical protein
MSFSRYVKQNRPSDIYFGRFPGTDRRRQPCTGARPTAV